MLARTILNYFYGRFGTAKHGLLYLWDGTRQLNASQPSAPEKKTKE
ncbi:MAG: hypothetical protein M3Y82_07405 [Verrucomicrobiota bacterium]|nr:hypothetical protein [Verrucomicrobiota bacterium]